MRCGASLDRSNRLTVCIPCASRGAAGARWLQPLGRGKARSPSYRVGQLFREYRTTHRLTQTALAHRLGFDQSYVSKVESGRQDIRDRDALRRIAEVLVVAPEDLGLSRDELPRQGRLDLVDGPVASSQRQWRIVREHLNHSREDLGHVAARLYDGCSIGRTGGPLLVRSDWLFPKPVDLDHIALEWSDAVGSPTVKGAEREANPVLPLRGPGRRYHRYSRAIRDLDRPTLFESRSSFRLMELDTSDPASPRMGFGRTTYFDMVDVCEAAAHELAAVHMAGKPVKWQALPFRRLIGDPFDLSRRPVAPSINTLTIRREGRGGSFIVHERNSSHVAVAGGMYHVMPAGMFQPSTILSMDEVNDFDLWRNVMREFSEEFLGNAEHDGSGAQSIDYDVSEPFRSLNAARRAGKLRIFCFGIGLDPLTLVGEILTAAVIDGDVFDDIFRDLVSTNTEGSILGIGGQSAAGVPFEHRNVERLLMSEPMAPAAAACLELAWRHRDVLLSTA
jgi:transcriptional regulator with XRE-family HTH domain